jgi:hypothetical protein
MSSASGRCHCGAVRFTAQFPSRFVAHCHCASCRRAHGAAFVTWVGFPSPQVNITQGAEQLAAHESSPQTFRRFCRLCGTKLFFESAKWPGETHVALAAFDDPVDRAPQGHAFYAEHASWLPPLADEPR